MRAGTPPDRQDVHLATRSCKVVRVHLRRSGGCLAGSPRADDRTDGAFVGDPLPDTRRSWPASSERTHVPLRADGATVPERSAQMTRRSGEGALVLDAVELLGVTHEGGGGAFD